MQVRRVVITGIGVMTPLGCSVQSFWGRLIRGECGIQKFPGDSHAPVDDNEFQELIMEYNKKYNNYCSKNRMQKFMQFALISADQAMQDANWYPRNQKEKEETGVAIGTGIGSLDEITTNYQHLADGNYKKVTPFMMPKLLYNLAAGYVSIQHDLQGPNHCVSTACATGAHSIGDAYRFIQRGDCNVMIAGSVESSLTPLGFAGFCRANALCTKFNHDPKAASRPFDKNRSGFVMGEGAGVIVLEEYEHAKKRGAPRIYAEIKGYSLAGDAYHVTAPSPDARAAVKVIKNAIHESKIHPEHVNYINAHATSTPAGDNVELQAIHSIFSPNSTSVSSIKGSIGHLLGAAGSVEAIATILSTYHNVIPPNINFESFDDEMMQSVQYVPWIDRIVTESMKKSQVDVSLCNSFGFGGTNASLLFSKVD